MEDNNTSFLSRIIEEQHDWSFLSLNPFILGTAFTPAQVEGCTDKMWSYVSIQPRGFKGRASSVLIQGRREHSHILLQAILGILVVQKTALRGITLVWRSCCTNEYAFIEYAGCGIRDGGNKCLLVFFMYFFFVFLWIIFVIFALFWSQILSNYYQMQGNKQLLLFAEVDLHDDEVAKEKWAGLAWLHSEIEMNWQMSVSCDTGKLNLAGKSWE